MTESSFGKTDSVHCDKYSIYVLMLYHIYKLMLSSLYILYIYYLHIVKKNSCFDYLVRDAGASMADED